METFIKASGLRIWDVIEHGNNVPLDDEGFAKPRSRFTNEDYALVELNHKAECEPVSAKGSPSCY